MDTVRWDRVNADASAVVAEAMSRGDSALTELEAMDLLAGYGVRVVRGRVVSTLEECLDAAHELSYPVVMKGSSRTILHKSDAGLVITGVSSAPEVEGAWAQLQERGRGELEGVLVEEMIPAGREFVIGMTRDAQFGPVVMFGVGGTLTEAIKDVTFGVAPLRDRDARRMLEEIRAKELLEGFRGAPPVDREALVATMQALGRLAVEHPEIDEIDINPLLVNRQGVPVAVDALVALGVDGAAVVKPWANRHVANTANLWALFHPASVAIVGASNDPTKWGGLILASLLSGGYEGAVYPVNPRSDSVYGKKSYPSVTELPEAVDLVLAAVPGPAVTGVVEDCGRRGVKACVIITAGFEEMGPEGAAKGQEAAAIAASYGMVLIGPNSLGTMCSWHRFYGTGAAVLQPDVGPASFLSQSGSMGMQLMNAAERHSAGIGKFVGLGNEALFEAADLLEYFTDDPETGVILAYLESLRDGGRLLRALDRASTSKPVILLRGGSSEFGRKAAASHTGAMASSQPVFEAAVRQAGAVYTTSPEEFLDLVYGFSFMPLPKGNRVAIVTFGGGWGVLAADEVARNGLQIADLTPEVYRELDELLPPFWSRGNPVDLAGMFTDKGEPEGAVHAVTPCENVDAVLVLGVLGIVSQPLRTVAAIERMRDTYGLDVGGVTVPDAGRYQEREDLFIRRVCEMMEEYDKPIINVSFSAMPKAVYNCGCKYSAVVLPSPLRAVRVVAQMARYRAYRESAQTD